MEFIARSPSETEKIGEEVIKKFSIPSLFCLFGELGSGKTTFIRGAARYFGIEKLRSPTFVYIFIYNLPNLNFYHIDLYRIDKDVEWDLLGFDEYLNDKKGIVFIEWADRIKKILPEKRIDVIFEIIDENTRKIIVKERG
ncbi:MAG: tRNA (adenosine(37)-N6)-threonylcarbamoyltransferase complex ATPase subunit type 1 TsaE [candidate division WOR-3 bacterium]